MDRLKELESNLAACPPEVPIAELGNEEGLDSEPPIPPPPTVEDEAHPVTVEATGGETPQAGDLDEKWAKLIDHMKAQNPILGSFLRYGRLLHVDDERIEIGFEKGSFYLEKMSEEENRRQCEEVCRDFFGKELRLVFRDFVGGQTDAGGEKEKNEGPTDRERHLRKEAMENSAIKDAVEIFDGTIEEIKTGIRVKS
jgi:hypothetical protein